MRLIAMSATLSAAIIAYSAVDVSVPILSTLSRSGELVRALSAASASVCSILGAHMSPDR